MWDSENERLGMKACTPLGYFIRGIGDLVGFFGLILLVFVPCYLVYRAFKHEFVARDWWLLCVPIILGLIGRLLFIVGCSLAIRKKFRYEDSRIATWIEHGQQRQYPPSNPSSTPVSK